MADAVAEAKPKMELIGLAPPAFLWRPSGWPLAVIRRVQSWELLFASSGIEREIVAGADPLELLPDLTVTGARVDHLIALKVLPRDDQRRPQDLVDLRALLRMATRTSIACT